MTQWNFYFSGILYGKFYEEAGTVLLEALDVETGCFLPRKPLEKTEDSFFSGAVQPEYGGFLPH